MTPGARCAALLIGIGSLPGAGLAAVTFTESSRALGIDNGALAQGCAFADYDGDGFPDLYLTDNRVFVFGAPNKLYHNLGGTSFRDEAPALGVDDGGTAFGCAWGDYDNDGRVDLFLVRGVFALLPEPHILYHNEGASTPWTKIQGGSAELPVPIGSGRSVAWADYDNDGWLDVLITNGLSCPIFTCPATTPTLLHNLGNGTFEDVTASSGLRAMINNHGVAWSDFDNDGWPDLFLVNHGFPDASIFETNVLYRNNHNGTFTDVTAAMKVRGDEDGNTRGCFGAAWADYDNDGWPDLYVTCGYDTVASASGFSTTNLLYHNLGGTGFQDVSLSSLTADPESSLGCAWGDYDNDGRIDLYVANGIAVPPAVPANRLFRNTGLFGIFTDEGAAAGVDSQDLSQAAAWADIDRDGDLDLYVTEVQAQDKLYRNNGGGGHWLELRLRGVVVNRAAIGARVYATTTTLPPGSVTQMREVNGGSGYLSQNDLAVHFGLGAATQADVEIHWPGPSFCIQSLGRVAADEVIDVSELCAAPPRVLRAPYALPLASVFPLADYLPLPAAAPFVDPQPVLAGPDPLLFYQIELPNRLSMVKSATSVALYY